MKSRSRILDRRRLCMVLDVVVLLVLAAWFARIVMSEPQSHYDPDRSLFPLKGIDVSAHNGHIDFRRVAADSVTFVMIKATEGTDFCDYRFKANIDSASAAGLKVGAYHFFRFDSPGRLQAEHFLSTVSGCTLQLPLAVDVEKWGNPEQYDTDEVRRQIRIFVDMVRSAGYPVMIYTNKQGYNSLIYDLYDDVPLWLCSLSGMPPADKWRMWQHSHQSQVDGVDGAVDVDTYNGTAVQMEQWAVPYTVNSPDPLLPRQ